MFGTFHATIAHMLPLAHISLYFTQYKTGGKPRLIWTLSLLLTGPTLHQLDKMSLSCSICPDSAKPVVPSNTGPANLCGHQIKFADRFLTSELPNRKFTIYL